MTTPAQRIAFGEHLRDLRREHGWASQEAFAHHVGLDRTYISGLERGSRNPTLDVIVKLAHGLDVTHRNCSQESRDPLTRSAHRADHADAK